MKHLKKKKIIFIYIAEEGPIPSACTAQSFIWPSARLSDGSWDDNTPEHVLQHIELGYAFC